MNKLILSLSVYYTIISAPQAKRLPCYACLNSVCYSPNDKISTDKQLSGQLAVDRITNTIYYHYQDNNSIDITKAFDLNKANSTIIPLNFTFAHTVDQDTRNVYLSGEKGIFKYDPANNSTEMYALGNKTIWHMQYEEKLYYTEFKKKGLYSYEKKSKGIPELANYLIDDFIIDKRGDIYFTSNSGLFLFRNGGRKPEMIEDEVYFLTTDKNGDAFFIQPYTRGIYKVNYRSRKITEVGAFRRGLAFKVIFDGDNHIVFYESTNKILYYLSPILSRCTVSTRGVGKNKRKFVSVKKTVVNALKLSEEANSEKLETGVHTNRTSDTL